MFWHSYPKQHYNSRSATNNNPAKVLFYHHHYYCYNLWAIHSPMFNCHSINSSAIISGLTQSKIRIISGSRSPRELYSFPQDFQLLLSSKNTGIPCFRIPGLGFRSSRFPSFRHLFFSSFRRLAHWHELFNAALLERMERKLFKLYLSTFWSQCCGNGP